MATPNEAFERCLPFARRIAAGYLRRLPSYVDTDDVMAAALAGLWRCALRHHRLDPAEFKTLARSRIIGSIADELRSADWLTRHARKGFGRELRRLLIDGFEFTDGIPELSTRPDIEGEMDRRELSRELAEAAACLPKRERFVVQSLLRGREMGKIAADLGVSQPRASQLLARAVERLRSELG